MYVSVSKVKIVTRSLEVTGSTLLRHHARSFSVDELADLRVLRQFQLEDDDHVPLSELSAELTSVQLTDTRPFQQIPGPRGLPLIGNMLSYSKLGRSASFRLLCERHDLRVSYLFFPFVFFFSFFMFPQYGRRRLLCFHYDPVCRFVPLSRCPLPTSALFRFARRGPSERIMMKFCEANHQQMS